MKHPEHANGEIGRVRRLTERIFPSKKEHRVEVEAAYRAREEAYRNFGDAYGGNIDPESLRNVLKAERTLHQLKPLNISVYASIDLNHGDIMESLRLGNLLLSMSKYWKETGKRQEKKDPFAALESYRRADAFENAREMQIF